MEPVLALTDTQISSWVAAFILPLFRVVAVLMTMPIFGTALVPRRIRLYFGLAITVVIAPSLPPMPEVHALDLTALMLVAQQILIGAAFGLCLQLLFQAFVIAGQIVATQMGMTFASMIDPINGVSSAIVGQFFTMLLTLLFLATNAHLVVFEVLVESFTTLPVGQGLIPSDFWALAVRMGWVFGAALVLVLPAITALLVINIAMGVMTRAAPQLNIFTIGYPMTLVLGLAILWVSLGDLLNQYQPLAVEALQVLRDLVKGH